ncbi:MAG: MoaD/ThiS family protein [Pseudomonadota bacterium]
MARLLFLGRLEDIAGADARVVAVPGVVTLAELLTMLPPGLAEALAGPKVKLALNGVLVSPADVQVSDSDELAFLPPVSGG